MNGSFVRMEDSIYAEQIGQKEAKEKRKVPLILSLSLSLDGAHSQRRTNLVSDP